MIAILLKIPLFAKLFGMLAGKSRLFVEYALIAAVVIIGGFSVGQWYSKVQIENRLAHAEVQLTTVSSRLVLVEAVNQAHEQTLLNLRELRKRDAQALEGLLTDYKTLSLRDIQVRSQIDALQKSNQVVSDYLDTAVPADLARMLNETAPNYPGNPDRYQDRTSGTAGGSGAGLHDAKVSGNPCRK